MGKSSTAVNHWMRDRGRFADLFNGVVFGGEQIVRPEELEEARGESDILVPDKGEKERQVQRYRDIVMQWKKGPYLAMLACESQSGIHYVMPVRNMLYDSLSYTEQIRRIRENNRGKAGVGKMTGEEFLSGMRKEDRICPVITLVLYYGEDEWDGSRNLYDMFPEGWKEQIWKMLEKYVPDYRINLVDVGKIGKIEKFTSDLQLIFGMLKYREDMGELQKYMDRHREYFQNVDVDTYRAVRELLHAGNVMEGMKEGYDRKEGTVNMCKALDDLYQKGVDNGMEQGIQALVEICRELGQTREVTEKKVCEKFTVSQEKVRECMEKYWA